MDTVVLGCPSGGGRRPGYFEVLGVGGRFSPSTLPVTHQDLDTDTPRSISLTGRTTVAGVATQDPYRGIRDPDDGRGPDTCREGHGRGTRSRTDQTVPGPGTRELIEIQGPQTKGRSGLRTISREVGNVTVRD